MFDFTRRNLLQGSAIAGLAAGTSLLDFAKAWAQAAPFKAEANAQLNLLRWKRFVEAEDVAFLKMIDAFIKATGVKVNVSNESFEDIPPKAAVAANTGQGLDLVWGLFSQPFIFPDKCLEVADVADYLGKKYGGWVPSAEVYGKDKDKWIAIPVAFVGGAVNYRISSLKKAGFDKVPGDTAGFLELCRALKKNNTPAGFALGHATGDANGWTHWILWAHGGYLTDKDGKVIINSPETAKALEYVKALYETFIPGTASWNDSSNNKAFLAGELHLTLNGISIYVAAKADATKKDIAEDMDHAALPVGPVGKPTELQLNVPILAFKHSKYPQACKALMAFMLEADNFNPWLVASQGYLTQPLNAYDSNPVWTADPKNAVYSQVGKRTLPVSGLGPITEKTAAALFEFIVVDMFASYCTGGADAKTAMANAERQAKRLFR
jgi:multiple sugar transport system substrate-binding protein